MNSGVGGSVSWCEACGKRRCMSPHKRCVKCRPPPPPRILNPEQRARANELERARHHLKVRRAVPVLAGREVL